MKIPGCFSVVRLAGLARHAVLYIGLLLLGSGHALYADELQDAYKLFKRGQHEVALGKVETLLLTQPQDAQARFLKGLILNAQGRSEPAIALFTALAEEFPELPEPYNNLAVLYAAQGHYDRARVALEMAIANHPEYATAHENLGDVHARMASAAYARAAQLDQGNRAIQNKLGIIQNMLGSAAVKPLTTQTGEANAKAP